MKIRATIVNKTCNQELNDVSLSFWLQVLFTIDRTNDEITLKFSCKKCFHVKRFIM